MLSIATSPTTIEAGPERLRGTPLLLYRLALPLTRAELGDRAGVHPETVARLERGENVPTTDTARRLAAALGVEPEDLGFEVQNDVDPAANGADVTTITARQGHESEPTA
jgi:transcriptional regulator with XRE-family HTH domain